SGRLPVTCSARLILAGANSDMAKTATSTIARSASVLCQAVLAGLRVLHKSSRGTRRLLFFGAPHLGRYPVRFLDEGPVADICDGADERKQDQLRHFRSPVRPVLTRSGTFRDKSYRNCSA